MMSKTMSTTRVRIFFQKEKVPKTASKAIFETFRVWRRTRDSK